MHRIHPVFRLSENSNKVGRAKVVDPQIENQQVTITCYVLKNLRAKLSLRFDLQILQNIITQEHTPKPSLLYLQHIETKTNRTNAPIPHVSHMGCVAGPRQLHSVRIFVKGQQF